MLPSEYLSAVLQLLPKEYQEQAHYSIRSKQPKGGDIVYTAEYHYPKQKSEGAFFIARVERKVSLPIIKELDDMSAIQPLVAHPRGYFELGLRKSIMMGLTRPICNEPILASVEGSLLDGLVEEGMIKDATGEKTLQKGKPLIPTIEIVVKQILSRINR